jgi:MFS family permease
MTYGYNSAIISTTLAQASFNAQFNLPGRSNYTSLTSIIVTMSQVAGMVGSLSVAALAERLVFVSHSPPDPNSLVRPFHLLSIRFGRKSVLLTACALAVVFSALQAGSVGLGEFIVFRTLGGWPTGMFLVGVPLYQSEVAPPHIRGRLMAVHGIVSSQLIELIAEY